MVNTLFLSIFIITILISTWILLKTKETIQILINSIFIFVIISGLLALTGHIFVAGIFIIVYAGAILVMICIGFLVSPPIRKKKIKDKISEGIDVYPKIILWVYISLLIVLITCIFYAYNTEFFLETKEIINPLIIEGYTRERKRYNYNINDMDEYFEFVKKLIHIIHHVEIKCADLTGLNESLIQSIFLKQEKQTDILDLLYTNNLSEMYTERKISFIALGIYLYFVLLVCLRIFMIISNLKKIKRQDIIDQLLKIWKKTE